MHTVRIKGLVREVDRIRRMLAAPMTVAQRDTLAGQLRCSLQAVEAILRRHRAKPAHLPPPSRRAYHFLRHLDLGQARIIEEGAGDTRESKGGAPVGAAGSTRASIPPESFSFRGLRAFLERVLDDAAIRVHLRQFDASASRWIIRQTASRLDHTLKRDGLEPGHLKRETRELAGWFRYFSGEANWKVYAEAVSRAQACLGGDGRRVPGWRLPLLVHFRPSRHLYRWQVMAEGTRIVLPAPAITFTDDIFEALGAQIRGEKRRDPMVTMAMLGEDFQAAALEMEAAGGIVERTQGMVHDLAESFDRVNHHYFAGAIVRPRLTWNQTLTGRKFGHYDFIRDTVMMSTTLDRRQVPVYVVDHVMHHELLHKKHGFRWQAGRQHAHTPEFRAEELTFERYHDADRFLRGMARIMR